MDAAIVQLGLVEDDTIQLDAAALELAALDHAGIDLDPYAAVLTAITEQVAALSDIAPSASTQGAALAEVIAGRGPCNAQRMAHKRDAHDAGAWVREAATAYAAKHAPGRESA